MSEERKSSTVIPGRMNLRIDRIAELESALANSINTEWHNQKVAELEAAGRALLKWESGRDIENENELAAIIERFRGLLEPSDKP